SQDDGIALDENFSRSVLGQQLVDWIVKIQAEIRGRIEAALKQRARQCGGLANIGLEDYVVYNFLFFSRALLFRQQKFVERVVDGRKFPKTIAAEDVDSVRG